MKFLIIYLLGFSIIISQINERLGYYPLNVGDSYQYKFNNSPTVRTISILKDSLFENGKIYKYLKSTYNNSDQIFESYERIDSLTGTVYKYENNSILENHEYMLDNLFAEKDSSYKTSRYFEGNLFQEFKTYCNDISIINLFNQSFQIKDYHDATLSGDGIDYYYSLIEGIGMYKSSSTSMSGSGGSTLIYAKVNGIEYGNQITNIKDRVDNLSTSIILYQNYPNPFNPLTNILLEIPITSKIDLSVYNIQGELVKNITNKEYVKGIYKFEFNGENLSSGIYFVRLKSLKFIKSIKILLLK